MSALIAIGILVALVLMAVGYGVNTYNSLISERLKVDNQWSQVDIVLKQRNDTIPNLVSIVKGYTTHEQALLQKVTQARSQYMAADSPDSAAKAAGNLSDLMAKFFAVAENYPELKANQNFMDLQGKYFALENKVADFRQFFNDTVMRYNRLVLSFPSSIIAGMFHFQQRAFFEAPEARTESPEIRF